MSDRALLSVKDFSKRHPAFSMNSLRYLIFNAETNGLAPAILRIGRKVLIDEDRFFRWLDRINGVDANAA